MSTNEEYVIVVDFGSQFAQLIVRRVRELGVQGIIVPFTTEALEEEQGLLKAIILSGSPASSTQPEHPPVPAWVFKQGVPVLGICYGQQIMAKILEGTVACMGRYELGRAVLNCIESSPLFEGLQSQEEVWMSHGDCITHLPEGFKVIGVSDASPYAAIAHPEKKLYGVQFHPEVTHTPCGEKIIKNFLYTIAGCSGGWLKTNSLDKIKERMRKKVGSDHVLCAVSGGVDSSVLFFLLRQALGENVTGIFIDTGLMRHSEAEEVICFFKNANIPLRTLEASEIFLSRLKGIEDPELKRKIIGATFIELFEEETKKLPVPPTFLAQGTLYPDVIESSPIPGAASVTIKSHHNVGGLPEHMKMKLLEPFRMLFKDEVRDLGQQMGLPEHLIMRHPFPGPGLAVRIMGDITKEKIKLLQDVDVIYLEELRQHGLYKTIWQAFSVLLPVRTVGVIGDSRAYDYVCALRAVTSIDGMTADFYPFDLGFLAKVSTRIVNEVKGIGRVTYDITSKPPATIEWE